MDDELKHWGVKGMKWGVRRYQPYQKGDGPKGKFTDKSKATKPTIKERFSSSKRERAQTKSLKDFDTMSPETQKKTVNRARLENDFKRLSKTKNVGSQKDQNDYIKNRSNMTVNELQGRVQTLQLKDNMRQQARTANKELIDAGKKVAAYAAPIVVQYAVKQAVDRNLLSENPIKGDTLNVVAKNASKFIDDLI